MRTFGQMLQNMNNFNQFMQVYPFSDILTAKTVVSLDAGKNNARDIK